jgi:hypothetical protein
MTDEYPSGATDFCNKIDGKQKHLLGKSISHFYPTRTLSPSGANAIFQVKPILISK